MKLRLLPEERGFYSLFRQDIAACKAGVAALSAMVQNLRESKEGARRVHAIEQEGDRVTAELFTLLNRTFVTPFEREDIISLSSIIDDVLDAVDETATMLNLFGIKQPSVYLLEAAALLTDTVDALAAAIDLLETRQGIAPLVAEVHRLENEADGLYHNAIAELFLPDTHSPLDVIKWSRVYDLMERAFDSSEDVGNVLQNVVLKNS